MELLNNSLVILFVITAITSAFGVVILDTNRTLLAGRYVKYRQLLIKVLNIVFGISLFIAFMITMTTVTVRPFGG